VSLRAPKARNHSAITSTENAAGRFLEGWGVIDPVAGHRHHYALRLPGPHDPELVLRRDAGIDGHVWYALCQLPIIHTIKLTPHDNPIPRLEDPQFTHDRASGVRVIARNHHRTNASALAPLDRVEGFSPRGACKPTSPRKVSLWFPFIHSY
jgi:hypothetical protein